MKTRRIKRAALWVFAIIGLLLFCETLRAEQKLGEEMLVNGAFEKGNPPEKWLAAFDVTLSQDVNPDSGQYCLKIVQSGKAGGYARQDVFPVPEEKYELSLKYKCQPGSTARIEMWDHKNGKGLFAEHKTETVWTGYKHIITAPAGCTSAGVLLCSFGEGSVVWYDSVSFKKIER